MTTTELQKTFATLNRALGETKCAVRKLQTLRRDPQIDPIRRRLCGAVVDLEALLNQIEPHMPKGKP